MAKQTVLKTTMFAEVAVARVPPDGLTARGRQAGRRALDALLERTASIVVDLSLVRHLDAGGLAVLVSLSRQCGARGGELKVCGLSPSLRVLVQRAAMHQVFRVYNTAEEALRAFAHQDRHDAASRPDRSDEQVILEGSVHGESAR